MSIADTVSDTATLLIVNVWVPHGISIGFRDVAVTTPGGSDRLPAYLSITPIVAGPQGDDASGRGTPDSPFRTLTRAAAATEFSLPGAGGDTVQLADGEYAGLETWPIIVRGTLRGSSRANTIVRPTGQEGLMAAEFVHLTVDGPGGAVPGSVCIQSSTSLEMTVTDVTARNCYTGIIAEGSTVLISNVRVEGATHGIWCWGSVTVTGTSVRADVVGIIAQGVPSIVLDGVDVVVNGNALDFNFTDTVTGSVRIRNSTISATNAPALAFRGTAVNYDFGSPAEPGNNSLSCPGITYCFFDSRAARPAPDGPIALARGMTINGTVYPAGVVVGPTMQAFYEILHANQRVEF